MEDPSLSGVEDKLAYFQAVTGLEDHDLCTEILSAHGWNLDLAVSSVTSPASPPPPQPSPSPSSSLSPSPSSSPSPSLAWKLVTLPFHVVTGGFGLAYAAFGLGAWVVGGVLSRSLGLVGSLLPPHPPTGPNDEADRLVTTLPPAAAEASSFVEAFDREYGVGRRPNFVAEGFMEALQRSRREFKLLFVYLHSPDHSDTPRFCSDCLCADIIADFVNENFVAWGGSIRGPEGFKMSNSLKASRFPFCAVVMASTNQRIALLQQIEGPKSPDEMLSILQQVLEEVRPSLVEARVGAEERMHSIRLREEQDAAYRAALEADQARERQKKEEQERLEREAAEAERKRKEEEEALERAAREAAEKEATIARRRQEKAMSLGVEPPKGPDVTQVVVRFPTGERKERRFHSSSPVKSIYDFVDSLECLKAEKYILVSNFPRTAYGLEMHSQSLREAGLHPNAMLFFEEAS